MTQAIASLTDIPLRRIDGTPTSLAAFEGQVLLVVNVASKCGLTPQYAGLEKLYETYRERGFAVLGFPANEFGAQEPGTNDEIQQFCSTTYGVQFPMFVKSHVRGPQANPLFKQLVERTGTTPKWNFYKYLISRDGRTVLAYNSLTAPDSAMLRRDIERLLGAS